MNKIDLCLLEITKGKKVCVLGYGREGRSTLKRLLVSGTDALVTVVDQRDVSGELPEGIGCVFGPDYLDNLSDYDIVLKTPGVVLPESFDKEKTLVLSETEVFMQCFKAQTIGITGTKGKSTTSSLLYHVLKRAGKDVLFAGNIGIPVFDIADDIKEDSIVVIELSCHQLEYAMTAPHVAILLNIYEDHLDHYITREKYGLAKKNIYIKQTKDDILLSTRETIDEWGAGESEILYMKRDILPFSSFEELGECMLRGAHNLLNASFVYTVVKMYSVSDEVFIDAVKSFKTLEHRLEFAGCFDGVDYYDDSISTTVKSTISAIESIKNSAYILIGGMERNISYEELVEYASKSKLKFLICMYESGKRFYDMYEALPKSIDAPKAVCVPDLETAVIFAKKNAKKGEAVLLSPAAASYGYFKNFEERGNIFKELVKKR